MMTTPEQTIGNPSDLIRQLYRKTTPAFCSVRQTDRAMVEQRKFFGDAKSQAYVPFVASGRVCLIESVKDIGFVLWRDTAAFILHLKNQKFLFCIYTSSYIDGTSGRGILEGVVKKDHEKLMDSLRIACYNWQSLVWKGEVKRNSVFLAHRLEGFKQIDEKSIHIDWFFLDFPGFGVRGSQKEHIVDQT